MKNNLMVTAILLFAVINFSFAQGLIISEVADGTGANGYPKIVEITNTSGNPIVMDGMKLKLYSNGGTSASTTYTITTFTLNGGESLVLTNIDNTTAGQLWTDFTLSTPTNVIYSVNAVNSNGDDVYELTDASDVVIDVYGVVGVDGTGQTWEFLDSYAYRNMSIVNGNQTFTDSEWTFGGADALDGLSADLSPYLTPGTHSFNAPTAPAISNVVISPTNPGVSDVVTVYADVVAQGSATISTVTCHWGTTSGSLTNSINMVLGTGNTYSSSTDIPAQANGTTVYYRIEATDNTPETSNSIEMSYFIGNAAPVIGNIVHTPATPSDADNVTVTADITDDIAVSSATLYWGLDGVSFPNSINMTVGTAPSYSSDTDIPAQSIGVTVYYYIAATDAEPLTTNSDTSSYTVVQQPGTYQFLNGEFENWTAGLPDDWTNIGDSITVTQESTIIHGGTYSAKFDVLSGNQSYMDFRQMVSVVGGTDYDLSVWVYLTSNTARCRIYCDGYLTWADTSIVDAWQQVTTTYSPTMNADIEVGLRFYDVTGTSFTPPVTIYVDDYTFDIASSVEGTVKNMVSIYPNPAKETVTFDNLENARDITITNISGQIVDYFYVSGNSAKYSISQLESGFYFAVVRAKDNSTKSYRFVKE